MHFCMDEAWAILMCVPILGYVAGWLRSRAWVWRNRHLNGVLSGCVHDDGARWKHRKRVMIGRHRP